MATLAAMVVAETMVVATAARSISTTTAPLPMSSFSLLQSPTVTAPGVGQVVARRGAQAAYFQ
jgi:hypothetical protein